MNFTFDTPEEYDLVRMAFHDAILYWKKVLQACQGKITVNCDGTPPPYSEKDCVEAMIENAEVLRKIELLPHPSYEWDEETESYSIVTVQDEYGSHMSTKTLKLKDRLNEFSDISANYQAVG